MNFFSNKFINIVTIIITIIIFLFIIFFINKAQKNESLEEVIAILNNVNDDSQNNSEEKRKEEINYKWYIKIEKIDLYAPIEETTEMEVLNKYVGHFENTSLENGNIGLAGHNRGYENNYFEKLKDVKIGDEVIYKYNDFIKRYIVDKIEIIRNTDWSYLEETEKNKITMITCTENEPEFRLCVQAIEKNS